MLSIYLAESGQLISVDASLRDIERVGSLEVFLSQCTGIHEDDVLPFLPDGLRLTSANVRELAGSKEQSIFVFNKQLLEAGYEAALNELHTQPNLQPPVEDQIQSTPPIRPSLVATNYLQSALTHLSMVKQTAASLEAQNRAIVIALASFDIHFLSISTTFAPIAEATVRELQRQQSLLTGLNADLQLISHVKVHSSFVSASVRRAIEAGERPRTLGDYVSSVKMRQVAETSRRTHEQLQSDYAELEAAITSLTQGVEEVRRDISNNASIVQDAESAVNSAQQLFDSIADRTSRLEDSLAEIQDADTALQELSHDDASLRDEVLRVIRLKNTYTSHLIQVLQHISLLNNTLAQIPDSLATLQTNVRNTSKGTGGGAAAGFGHIQRLHRMLFAYSATVVEIVRRKEFARFFYARAQRVLEVISKLAAAERKQRLAFRSEVHGQLPFDVRGLGMGGNAPEDDPIPNVELVFSPSPSETPNDGPMSLSRSDVNLLLGTFDELENFARTLSVEDKKDREIMLHAVSDCKGAITKLVEKMDGMEDAWEKTVERGLLSSSKHSFYRHSRRSTSYDDQTYQELTDLLRAAQEREEQWTEERKALKSDLARLSSAADDAIAEQSRADRLERDLQHVRQQYESECTARRYTEERLAYLSENFEAQQKELARALADATSQAQVAETLRSDLGQLRSQFHELEKIEDSNAKKVQDLLQEQQTILRNLEETHGRGMDLEAQIKAARKENQDMILVNEQLRADKKEKEKMLREHELAARDMRAEADGDRAVLEREFFEVKAKLEEAERAGRDARKEAEIANIDSKGLREELKRAEAELRELHNVERLLRDDLRVGRNSQEQHEHDLETKNRLVAGILDVAIAFRNSHVKAMATAQNALARFNSSTLAESGFPSSMRHHIIGQPDVELSTIDIDPTNPESALDILRAFDHDTFTETIAKTVTTIRKWQRQCKEYRERAKGKISFRNFAKGDLALFLPTRNSVSKPWAAFNVSFPHYFLHATGHLAEQLPQREWIVARITSIAERVVDSNDPSSNPYGLGDGTKYYMLQVEDWTQPPPSTRRRSTGRKSSGAEKQIKEATPANAQQEPLPPPPGPPSADVEDTFHVMNSSNSHLFPIRSRSNSTAAARPSSLSRLLAQASPEHTPAPPAEPLPSALSSAPISSEFPSSPPKVSSSPTPSPGLPSPHSHNGGPAAQHGALGSSPLRPGSRSSRISSASRFSVGRIPVIGSGTAAKAAATTAITEQPLSTSPLPDNPFMSPSTPSPEGSMFESIASLPKTRRRTSSYHVPRDISTASQASTSSPTESSSATIIPSRAATTATGALANLVSGSWGFGRKRRTDVVAATYTSPQSEPSAEDRMSTHGEVVGNQSTNATDTLRKFRS